MQPAAPLTWHWFRAQRRAARAGCRHAAAGPPTAWRHPSLHGPRRRSSRPAAAPIGRGWWRRHRRWGPCGNRNTCVTRYSVATISSSIACQPKTPPNVTHFSRSLTTALTALSSLLAMLAPYAQQGAIEREGTGALVWLTMLAPCARQDRSCLLYLACGNDIPTCSSSLSTCPTLLPLHTSPSSSTQHPTHPSPAACRLPSHPPHLPHIFI